MLLYRFRKPLDAVQVEKSAESHVEPLPVVLVPPGNVCIYNNTTIVCPTPTTCFESFITVHAFIYVYHKTLGKLFNFTLFHI